MENKEGFNFTYSAKEREEVKSIRDKYVANETDDKMALLRRLDASVTRKATSVALALGVIGTLLLGMGMSLAMTDLALYLNLTIPLAMIVGISVGLVGILLVCLAYPAYNSIVKTERKRIAPQIISLTDELMK